MAAVSKKVPDVDMHLERFRAWYFEKYDQGGTPAEQALADEGAFTAWCNLVDPIGQAIVDAAGDKEYDDKGHVIPFADRWWYVTDQFPDPVYPSAELAAIVAVSTLLDLGVLIVDEVRVA